MTGPRLIRPGPFAIDAGECPGGVVIHAYSVPTARLVLVRHADPATITDADVEADADAALLALEPGEDGVCLVAFDGDNGDRMVWP